MKYQSLYAIQKTHVSIATYIQKKKHTPSYNIVISKFRKSSIINLRCHKCTLEKNLSYTYVHNDSWVGKMYQYQNLLR